MRWIDALSVSAQMVDFQSLRNRTNRQFVSHSMRTPVLALQVEYSITVSAEMRRPFPTVAAPINLCPKPFFHGETLHKERFRLPHNARSLLPLIVHCTKLCAPV